MARNSLIPQRVKNTGLDLLTAGLFIGGSLVALSFVNKRFGIIDRFVSGASGLGFGIGEAVGSGLKSIPQGLIKGTLGISAEQTQANLNSNLSLTPLPSDPLFGTEGFFTKLFKPQEAYGDTGTSSTQKQGGFAELITAIEKNPFEDTTRNLTSGRTFANFTDIFRDIQAAPAGGATPSQPLNVANLIKQAGQRISQQSTIAQTGKLKNQYGTLTTKNPFGGFASANTQETTLQALIAANAKRYPQYFKVV